ncbi:MAG: hypothetical protein KC501_12795, partial [Myxococcales bacterium]|nr:hypothetical protein [Myxococcales bacterium]
PHEESRLAGLLASFAGGRNCDAAALTELRGLRDRYGTPPSLREALLQAFAACEEQEATAELLAATLSPTPSTDERLQLGAAWLRASRYEEATEILLPLAQEQGPGTKAAWLAGFALFHAGRSGEALPWLEGARDQVGGGNVTDAPLLIGLSLLHQGQVDRAITELEAGRDAAPEDRSILSALARAYATAGRGEDAEQASARVRELNQTNAAQELQMARLSALSSALKTAQAEGHNDDADRIIEEMLPMAPAQTRPKLLELRARLYDEDGRTEDAAAVRQQIATGGTP